MRHRSKTRANSPLPSSTLLNTTVTTREKSPIAAGLYKYGDPVVILRFDSFRRRGGFHRLSTMQVRGQRASWVELAELGSLGINLATADRQTLGRVAYLDLIPKNLFSVEIAVPGPRHASIVVEGHLP